MTCAAATGTRLIAIVSALLLGLLATSPQAHVTELAVLSILDMGNGTYRIVWEAKPNTEIGSELEPIFPEHCVHSGAELDCGQDGLAGTIGFEGIGEGQSAALFKLRTTGGGLQVITLTPAQPTAEIRPDFDAESWAGLWSVFAAYLQIGIEHILLGIDHLLFVLGLLWISRGRWMLFKTITAFTLAHSVTLTAVTFGYVGVPEPFVNAMIALSIAFVGLEVINAQRGISTFTLRQPWIVAFLFGLLHGFGFANALVQLGLPEGAVPTALIAFNLGVELGQIAFVLLVLALAWAYREMRVHWPDWSRPIPAYAIGSVGAFWFFERTAILLGA